MNIGQLVGVIAGAIATLIGALWPIIKYYSDKKDKKQQTLIQKFTEEIIEPVQEINARLKKVEEETNRQAAEIQHNEMRRLRNEIMTFARELRNGADMDNHDFEHIFKVYDTYVKYGGNSYAHAEMDFIKQFKVEYDKTLKGETTNNE